jgi:hypothetical protein
MALRIPRWKSMPRFYVDEMHRVQWRQVKEGIPKCYHQYWMVFYDGEHVADFFCGKKHWYAVIFDHGTVRDDNLKRLCLVVSGLYAHPNN